MTVEVVSYTDEEECWACGGWAGPTPIDGRFCSSSCAAAAVHLKARDDAVFAALRRTVVS